MCGIVGWVEPGNAPIEEQAIRSMARMLAHRGPDGEGFHVEPGCGLGHRRLALIDLPGGKQPLANDTGTVWVVGNNEIYNYLELRHDLVARGHRFSTESDTEVLVHLYEDLGEDCVDPLVGMYAFALWDRDTRTLLLARDRFGIKPLYYTIDTHGALRFASELRALATLPGIDRTIDLTALHDYLRDLTIPEPRTIFRGVYKLPAAHCLIWRDGEVRLQRYWHLPDRSAAQIAEADAEAELERKLVESTSLSLRSDVPIGLFLSGGLDSSTLAWAMHRCGAAPLRTFSVSFAEAQFDEGPHSRAVAAAFGSEHYEVRVSKDDAIDTALQLLAWFDEPFADSSAIPTYILSREARRHVKAVLAGEGADEIFAGSGWHQATQPRTIADLIAPPAKVVFGAQMIRDLVSTDVRARLDAEPVDDESRIAADLPSGLDPLHAQLYVDLRHYLPSDLLMKIDRMSMLNSLETRVPYLNHPLVEYVWTLPTALKLRGSTRKYLLRKIAEKHLPAAVVQRGKQGFAVPMDMWMWEPGRFHDAVYDTLRGARCRDRGLFDAARVDAMLDDHDRLHQVHGYRLWALFVLERWLEQSPVNASW